MFSFIFEGEDIMKKLLGLILLLSSMSLLRGGGVTTACSFLKCDPNSCGTFVHKAAKAVQLVDTCYDPSDTCQKGDKDRWAFASADKPFKISLCLKDNNSDRYYFVDSGAIVLHE